MTDAELEALMRATGTEGFPSDVRRLVEAVEAQERERWASAAENYDLGTVDGHAIAAIIRASCAPADQSAR
jgi:hypothetical protein